jgi:hypothetical protein
MLPKPMRERRSCLWIPAAAILIVPFSVFDAIAVPLQIAVAAEGVIGFTPSYSQFRYDCPGDSNGSNIIRRILPIPCGCEVIRVLPYGRFGNNFIQLSNALSVALLFNIKHILVECDYMYFNRSFATTDGIWIHPECSEIQPGYVVASIFWTFEGPSAPVIQRIPDEVIADTFSSEFRRLFYWDHTNKSVLYCYLRSGDSWRPEQPHVVYRKPPCSYYFEGIDFNGGPANAELITEDYGNPCVPVLVAAGVRYTQRRVQDDLAILINGDRVMTAISSFIRATMMISTGPKTVYSFNTIWPRYLPHMVCKETKEYSRAMTPWNRTETQKRDMLRIKGCAWRMAGQNRSQ